MATGYAECEGCAHVSALHKALGPCRLNGCPCAGFLSPFRGRDREPELAPVEPLVESSEWVIRTLCLAVGLILGIALTGLLTVAMP